MIRGYDLFGREAISPNEKLIVETANRTAKDLFKRRFDAGLKENWDTPAEDLLLEEVEQNVVEAILKGYPDGSVRNAATQVFKGTLRESGG